MRTLLPTLAVNSLLTACASTPLHPSATRVPDADVFRPDGPPRATVLLLHGWSDRATRNYLPWIRHLTAQGLAVVFPYYQESLRSSRKQMVAGAEVGLRAGLAALGSDHGPIIAAGYSYGAGLAVIAAAEADAWQLPVPAAVYGVFPFFVRRNDPAPLVLPHGTTVELVVGDRDQVVGRRGAAAIARSIAPHPSSLDVLESGPEMSFGHLSVLQTGAAAQAAFWDPLDRIVDRVAPR